MQIAQIHATPLRQPETRKIASIGELLVKMGKLDDEQLGRVLDWQKKAGLRFGEVANKLGLVSATDVKQALAMQFRYSYLNNTESKGKLSENLVAAFEPFSARAEALRALRSQLMLQWFDRGQKLLAVIGAHAGEGCSELAANLAVVFSQLGERTLLVDANLRDPQQHRTFNIQQPYGLSDMLIGRVDQHAIARITDLEGLHVLPAGTLPPNPQELLSRKNFGALMHQLGEQYDVVIVDTAPAAMNSDAHAVATRCGGALMVSRLNKTKLAEIANIRDQLVFGNVEIVAAIVNE